MKDDGMYWDGDCWFVDDVCVSVEREDVLQSRAESQSKMRVRGRCGKALDRREARAVGTLDSGVDDARSRIDLCSLR